ncbi:hypothetical protein EUGRSUZ_B00595 [Eucalyptus grandis]|uniref:Uncharacterized protein n=2 Tax=Eucalyptus grandis TaxID=71139 RepID=A0ACC3LPR3_EUCGR|nr:hypothetical protein EUGRSUZ_B00595 [Eucalyptus grandis]
MQCRINHRIYIRNLSRIMSRITPLSPHSSLNYTTLMTRITMSHRPRLVNQSRDILIPRYCELHQEPQRPHGQQNSSKIIQRHSNQQNPSRPFGQHGKPISNQHPNNHQIPLRHENRHLGHEHGQDTHDRKIEQDHEKRDAIDRDAEILNQEQRNFTSQESQHDESRETHVELQEPGAPQVEQEHQHEGHGGDDGHEREGVPERAHELVPVGVGVGLGVGDGGHGGDRGGRRRRRVQHGDQDHHQEHANRDGGDDPDDLLAQGIEDAGGSGGLGHWVPETAINFAPFAPLRSMVGRGFDRRFWEEGGNWVGLFGWV